MSVAHPPPKDLAELLLRLDHWAKHFDTPMAKDCGYAATAIRALTIVLGAKPQPPQ